MKIALLVCDDSNKSFSHNSGSYVDMFQVLFEESDYDVDLIPFDVRIGHYPIDLSDFSGFLTTGSAHSVYDDFQWIDELKEFLKKLYDEGHKYFGICFGHQLIAETFGGSVKKAPSGWMVGLKETKVFKKQSWMLSDKMMSKAISSHQDQILELPLNAERIGTYEGCANAMIKLGDKFIGFQSHPEFKKEYAKPLMESREDRVPAEVIAAARPTFEISPDHKLIANWIISFFKNES